MSIGNAGSNTTTASNAEISNLLVQGFKAAKEGRRDEAYDIFCDVVRRDPNNELGWLYRAATTQDLSEAYVCLQRVLNINPANEKAQRGVERIQNRLSAESNNRTAATNGGLTAAAVTQPIAEREVISGFNQGFSRSSAPEAAKAPSQTQPTRYPYQQAPSPFNQVQPAQAEDNAAPPPYRPDFGQLNNPAPGAIDRPPTAQTRAPRPPLPAYTPANYTPAGEAKVGDTEEMADEPVYSGPAGSQRETTNSRRAFLVGGLASARQRGRAAFGTDTPTDLDRNGQRRSRQILIPLVILGIILVIAALLVLLLPVFTKNSNDTATTTSVAVASATTSAATANTPVNTSTPGNKPEPTSAVAVTVPVVGATTAAVQTTAAPTSAPATTAAAIPTVAPVTTAAATATSTAPATTQAPTATAAPPAPATQAPPPATTAPAAPALPRATVYVIKGGDNLTRIASQYSTSIAAIQAANPGLQQNTIFAGNRIVVPVSRPDFRGKGAIIGANQTLQTIADRYKVNVDDLARFNGYGSPADAKPGDAVLIP